MEKVSIAPSNKFCPQPLFLYGTYKEDGRANFGTFVWYSYCWDGEMGVMACIGGPKLTRDRIGATKVFSANLVTEPLLPLADFLGNNPGYTTDKASLPINIEHGAVLPVPVLADSPWVFELEVSQTISLDDSDLFLCKVRNVLAAKELEDDTLSTEEKMKLVSPVVWFGAQTYNAVNPIALGKTGDWAGLHSAK